MALFLKKFHKKNNKLSFKIVPIYHSYLSKVGKHLLLSTVALCVFYNHFSLVVVFLEKYSSFSLFFFSSYSFIQKNNFFRLFNNLLVFLQYSNVFSSFFFFCKIKPRLFFLKKKFERFFFFTNPFNFIEFCISDEFNVLYRLGYTYAHILKNFLGYHKFKSSFRHHFKLMFNSQLFFAFYFLKSLTFFDFVELKVLDFSDEIFVCLCFDLDSYYRANVFFKFYFTKKLKIVQNSILHNNNNIFSKDTQLLRIRNFLISTYSKNFFSDSLFLHRRFLPFANINSNVLCVNNKNSFLNLHKSKIFSIKNGSSFLTRRWWFFRRQFLTRNLIFRKKFKGVCNSHFYIFSKKLKRNFYYNNFFNISIKNFIKKKSAMFSLNKSRLIIFRRLFFYNNFFRRLGRVRKHFFSPFKKRRITLKKNKFKFYGRLRVFSFKRRLFKFKRLLKKKKKKSKLKNKFKQTQHIRLFSKVLNKVTSTKPSKILLQLSPRIGKRLKFSFFFFEKKINPFLKKKHFLLRIYRKSKQKKFIFSKFPTFSSLSYLSTLNSLSFSYFKALKPFYYNFSYNYFSKNVVNPLLLVNSNSLFYIVRFNSSSKKKKISRFFKFSHIFLHFSKKSNFPFFYLNNLYNSFSFFFRRFYFFRRSFFSRSRFLFWKKLRFKLSFKFTSFFKYKFIFGSFFGKFSKKRSERLRFNRFFSNISIFLKKKRIPFFKKKRNIPKNLKRKNKSLSRLFFRRRRLNILRTFLLWFFDHVRPNVDYFMGSLTHFDFDDTIFDSFFNSSSSFKNNNTKLLYNYFFRAFILFKFKNFFSLDFIFYRKKVLLLNSLNLSNFKISTLNCGFFFLPFAEFAFFSLFFLRTKLWNRLFFLYLNSFKNIISFSFFEKKKYKKFFSNLVFSRVFKHFVFLSNSMFNVLLHSVEHEYFWICSFSHYKNSTQLKSFSSLFQFIIYKFLLKSWFRFFLKKRFLYFLDSKKSNNISKYNLSFTDFSPKKFFFILNLLKTQKFTHLKIFRFSLLNAKTNFFYKILCNFSINYNFKKKINTSFRDFLEKFYKINLQVLHIFFNIKKKRKLGKRFSRFFILTKFHKFFFTKSWIKSLLIFPKGFKLLKLCLNKSTNFYKKTHNFFFLSKNVIINSFYPNFLSFDITKLLFCIKKLNLVSANCFINSTNKQPLVVYNFFNLSNIFYSQNDDDSIDLLNNCNLTLLIGNLRWNVLTIFKLRFSRKIRNILFKTISLQKSRKTFRLNCKNFLYNFPKTVTHFTLSNFNSFLFFKPLCLINSLRFVSWVYLKNSRSFFLSDRFLYLSKLSSSIAALAFEFEILTSQLFFLHLKFLDYFFQLSYYFDYLFFFFTQNYFFFKNFCYYFFDLFLIQFFLPLFDFNLSLFFSPVFSNIDVFSRFYVFSFLQFSYNVSLQGNQSIIKRTFSKFLNFSQTKKKIFDQFAGGIFFNLKPSTAISKEKLSKIFSFLKKKYFNSKLLKSYNKLLLADNKRFVVSKLVLHISQPLILNRQYLSDFIHNYCLAFLIKKYKINLIFPQEYGGAFDFFVVLLFLTSIIPIDREIKRQVEDTHLILKKLKTYRGMRLSLNLPSHGQRTHTNAKTARNKNNARTRRSGFRKKKDNSPAKLDFSSF